jgi:hypothetical protein
MRKEARQVRVGSFATGLSQRQVRGPLCREIRPARLNRAMPDGRLGGPGIDGGERTLEHVDAAFR